MIIREVDDCLVIKVLKNSQEYFDIFDVDSLQNFFGEILPKLRLKYNLSGLVEAQMYINEAYGMILELRRLEEYEDEIDIKIKVHLIDNFLVEIDSSCILDYENVYYYEDKFYGTYEEFCDNEVLYKDIEKIINMGIQVC